MPPNLPTLPTETISSITSHLEFANICSLRQACRKLDHKILEDFDKRYFAIISTDLTYKSLARLNAIASIGRPAQRVTTIHIRERERLGCGLLWDRDTSDGLESTSFGVETLQKILVDKLVNCKSIHIKSYGEIHRLSPYQQAKTLYLAPSDIVGMIMYIIANGGLAIKSFSITTKSGDPQAGRMNTQRLQTSLCETERFLAAWTTIEELDLSFAMTPDQYSWALGLIWNATNLRKLALSFDYCPPVGTLERFGRNLMYAKLQYLVLDSAVTTSGAIWDLLYSQRDSIETLSVQRTKVVGQGSWATIFGRMVGNFPRLRNISMCGLEEWGSSITEESHLVFSKMVDENPEGPSFVALDGDNDIARYNCSVNHLRQSVELAYWEKLAAVVGVQYKGSHSADIDQFLSALVQSAETMGDDQGICSYSSRVVEQASYR